MSWKTNSVAGDGVEMRVEKWEVQTSSGQGVRPDVRVHLARICLEFDSEKPLNIIPPEKEEDEAKH